VEISQGLVLDQDGTTIKADKFAGNPLQEVAALRMEAPLFVTIIQAEVNGTAAVNAVVVYTGEITTASPKGNRTSAKTVSGGTLFDRMIPRVRFQRNCNNSLFDAGCALDQSDWQWTATILDPAFGDFEIEVNNLTDPAGYAGPAVGQNFYSLGWVEIGSGANWQARAVLLNSVPAAGVLSLTLDRDLDPAPSIGDSILIIPGCPGDAATCAAKFNNYLNFLGHPFMPFANPSLVKPSQTSSGGKK
jgi:uncharacterized phage protein (TIGR02218 family)